MQVCCYVENVTFVNSTLHMVGAMDNSCKPPGIPKEALRELSLSEVDDNQFHVFMEYWFSQKGMIVIVTVV